MLDDLRVYSILTKYKVVKKSIQNAVMYWARNNDTIAYRIYSEKIPPIVVKKALNLSLKTTDFDIIKLFSQGASVIDTARMLNRSYATINFRYKRILPFLFGLFVGAYKLEELETFFKVKASILKKKRKDIKRKAKQILDTELVNFENHLDPEEFVTKTEEGFSTVHILVELQKLLSRLIERTEQYINNGDVGYISGKNLIIRAASELRAQIDTYIKMLEKVYNIYAIAEFQKVILDAIAKADQETRDRIIRELKKKSAIYTIVDSSIMDWESGGDKVITVEQDYRDKE